MTADYKPKQGDIVFLDFNPQKGHEQKGKRPAVIIERLPYDILFEALNIINSFSEIEN
jgi:mRNA interferase MazF